MSWGKDEEERRGREEPVIGCEESKNMKEKEFDKGVTGRRRKGKKAEGGVRGRKEEGKGGGGEQGK